MPRARTGEDTSPPPAPASIGGGAHSVNNAAPAQTPRRAAPQQSRPGQSHPSSPGSSSHALTAAEVAADSSGNATPAQQQQLIGELNRLGIPDSTQGIQFLEDELDTGNGGAFAGFKLPDNVSRHDFFAVVTAAETYAAGTGWSHYPTGSQILGLVQQGAANWNAQKIGAALGTMRGTSATFPWANYGMTADQWNQRTQTLDGIASDLTGQDSWDTSGLDASLKATIIGQGWDASRIKGYFQSHADKAGQYGWLKYGMGYNDFQNYKRQNAVKVQSRYGANASDTQYLEDYAAPLAQFNAQATTVSTQPSPGGQAAKTGNESFVR